MGLEARLTTAGTGDCKEFEGHTTLKIPPIRTTNAAKHRPTVFFRKGEEAKAKVKL